MRIYAVIDTNVIVSALITKNTNSATLKVIEALFTGRITPLYHQDIIDEYKEVLSRPKFHIKQQTIDIIINSILTNGIEVFPKPT